MDVPFIAVQLTGLDRAGGCLKLRLYGIGEAQSAFTRNASLRVVDAIMKQDEAPHRRRDAEMKTRVIADGAGHELGLAKQVDDSLGLPAAGGKGDLL